jgi:hypothetical protein
MDVASCFEGIFKTFDTQNVIHHILMLDELKVEEHLHMDEETNMILGPFWKHGKNTSLEFSLEKEVQLLLEALDKGEVHLSTEVGLIIVMEVVQ